MSALELDHSLDPLAPDFDPVADRAGADLLDKVASHIARFCVFPSEHCLPAVVLWAAHAHVAEHLHFSPRLAIISAEPASGKSRVLEVLHSLTPESLHAIDASSATIFRLLSERRLTLLFDEVDTIFKRRGKDDPHEDLRGLLNAGCMNNATIPRCIGPKHEVKLFPVFCPVALAGIGDLPDTIMSRSVIVRMRRRAPTERVEAYRPRYHAAAGYDLRDMLAQWAEAHGVEIGRASPTMPDGVEDRAADAWEGLLAIADAAGGDWPDRARRACSALVAAAQEREQSLGIRLLADLRTIFGDAGSLATETILVRLKSGPDSGLDADSPWSDLRGEGLSQRGLASMLKQYAIKPAKVRPDGGRPLQGYRRADLWDAWQRYLPLPPETAEHAEQAAHSAGVPAVNVPDVPDCPDSTGTESACLRCDGEGCRWCAPSQSEI